MRLIPGSRAATEVEVRIVSSSVDDIDDVIDEGLGDMNLMNGLHRGDEVFRAPDRFICENVELGLDDGAASFFLHAQSGVTQKNLSFLLDGRVVQPVEEHEAIELRLGKLKRSRLLDRILGGDHEKRGGKAKGLVADGDLAFLHRLEESPLNFRSGAVDFVREEKVCEDRAFMDSEFIRPLVEDF